MAQYEKLTSEDLDNLFSYHAPKHDQLLRYQSIREGARVFAEILVLNTPGGPQQDAAIMSLSDTVMKANRAIALEG